MKNEKTFKVAFIALLVIGSQVLFGFKPVSSKLAYKLKSVHMNKLNARQAQYYFYFSDGNGNNVTLSGRGGVGSGNINTFIIEYFGTNPSNAVAAGTASGTYVIDLVNNTATINVTFQAYGHTQQSYNGFATYSSI